MNLAFPALLILLYVLPGVVFTNGVLNSSSRLAGSKSLDWSTQIAYGAVLALPIHWVALTIAERIHFYDVIPNLSDALILLTDKDAKSAAIIYSIALHRGPISVYFSIVTLCAYPAGQFIGVVLAASGFQLFRSQWDARFRTQVDHKLFISAVVERGGTMYLYVGIYFDKIIDEKGTLRGIWLSSPRRRALGADIPGNAQAEIFYPIETDVLFLATEKVQTISFKYFQFPPTEEIKQIAFALWEERKNKQDNSGSPEQDWRRAQLLFQHRLKNSKGWRQIALNFSWFMERYKREEEKLKNSSTQV